MGRKPETQDRSHRGAGDGRKVGTVEAFFWGTVREEQEVHSASLFFSIPTGRQSPGDPISSHRHQKETMCVRHVGLCGDRRMLQRTQGPRDLRTKRSKKSR